MTNSRDGCQNCILRSIGTFHWRKLIFGEFHSLLNQFRIFNGHFFRFLAKTDGHGCQNCFRQARRFFLRKTSSKQGEILVFLDIEWKLMAHWQKLFICVLQNAYYVSRGSFSEIFPEVRWTILSISVLETKFRRFQWNCFLCALRIVLKERRFFSKKMFFLHNFLLGAKFWKVCQNCFLWAQKIDLRGENYRKRSFFHHSRIWRKNVALLLKRSREVSQNCIQGVLRILLKENISFENLFYRFRCLKKKLLNFCEGYRLRNPKRDLCAQRKILRNRSIIFFNNVVFMQTFAVLSAKSSSKVVRPKVYVSSVTL